MTLMPLGGSLAAFEVGDWEVTFDGADFDGSVTTFSYRVQVVGNDEPGLSHIAFGVGCPPALVESVHVAGGEFVNPDPTTGFTGIKFDTGLAAGEATYSYSLLGSFSLNTVGFVIKAGTQNFFGTVVGPVCEPPRLRVEKLWVDGVPNLVSQLTVSGPSFPAGTTVSISGTGSVDLGPLEPGTYTVTEAAAPNVGVVSILPDEDPASPGAQVTLTSLSGLVTVAVLNNLELSLQVEKDWLEGDGPVSVRVTGPAGFSEDVTLAADGASATFSDLVAGAYTVQELTDDHLVRYVPSDGDDSDGSTVELGADVPQLTVRIENRIPPAQLFSLRVEKDWLEGDGAVSVRVTGPAGFSEDVTLAGDGASTTFGDLAAGAYTVQELTDDHLVRYVPSDGDDSDGSTVALSAVAPQLTVRIENRIPPAQLFSLRVEKDWLEGDGPVSVRVTGPAGFSEDVTLAGDGASATFSDLAAGEYTVRETTDDALAGYLPSDGTDADGVTVPLAAGDGEVTVIVQNRAVAVAATTLTLAIDPDSVVVSGATVRSIGPGSIGGIAGLEVQVGTDEAEISFVVLIRETNTSTGTIIPAFSGVHVQVTQEFVGEASGTSASILDTASPQFAGGDANGNGLLDGGESFLWQLAVTLPAESARVTLTGDGVGTVTDTAIESLDGLIVAGPDAVVLGSPVERQASEHSAVALQKVVVLAQTAQLSVRKVWLGAAQGPATIQLTGPGGFSRTFELADGELRTFDGLVAGAYTVRELSDEYLSGYEPSDGSPQDGTTVVVEASAEAGVTVEVRNQFFTFPNTGTGGLASVDPGSRGPLALTVAGSLALALIAASWLMRSRLGRR